MNDDDTATESHWWNEDTTYYEVVRRYAEERGDLTPENLERFVADQGDSTTVKQYADRIGLDLPHAYEATWEGLMWSDLERKFDHYYTIEQLATQILKRLHTRPRENSTPFRVACELEKDLALLSTKCEDNVRVVALEAAAKAAARLTSEELKAVLAKLAGIQLNAWSLDL